MFLSVVLPAYNEAENITKVVEELNKVIAKVESITSHEICVVDDHSSDNTYETVQQLGYKNVYALRLSRRSGSHTAIRAGLKQAKGDAVLCISADGQDNIGVLGDMIAKVKAGKHIIWGIREKRDEPIAIKLFALLFYRLLTFINPPENKNIDYSRADFYLLDRKVVDAVNNCKEKNTSIFGLIIWLGFKQDIVEYQRRERFSGKSKWNFKSRLNLAGNWIMAFSGLPLRVISFLGVAIATLGFIYAIIIIIMALTGMTTPGWAETVIITLIMGGVQMTMLGVVGEYLWKALDESRNRPLYFIEESSEITEKSNT